MRPLTGRTPSMLRQRDSRWKDRFKGWGIPSRADGSRRYGVGMGLSGHSDIGGMASNTNVTMTSAGGVMIQTVMTEFGSGVRDVYRKIVAEELCIPVDRVRVSISDTSAAPLDFWKHCLQKHLLRRHLRQRTSQGFKEKPVPTGRGTAGNTGTRLGL